ncbi:MAG: ABC transporter permease [Gemmatimonadales bacterium]|nr:ABC transporter permease [Gemmatimonadales bacterium]
MSRGVASGAWGGAVADPPARGPWHIAWRRFRGNRAAVLGLSVSAAVVLAALLAPLLAPFDPNAQPDPVLLQQLAPNTHYLLGTDAFSRDVLSRLIFGARVSLAVGLGAALLAVLIGGSVGLVAGLARPWLDRLLMRGVDIALALPRIFLLLAVFALWEGVPVGVVILLIAATGWFETSRLVRAHVRSLRTADFVLAATALGAGRRGIARHLLPHVAATIIVSATLDVGNIILLEAGLSYLGLGVRLPTPTWGNMILDGRHLLFTAPWVVVAPGVALVLTVVAFNLVGDGLRDALDPRLAR